MLDPRFVDYVRAHQDEHPMEAIRQALAKAGVSSAHIEEAVRLAQGAAPPPVESRAAPYSHPDAPVRHSYPVAPIEDGFFAALPLYLKTLPFVGLRFGLLAGCTLAGIVWCGLMLFLGGLAAKVAGGLGFWAVLLGMGLPAGAFLWLKRSTLYLLKMAHVAVLTRLITHGELPAGVDQVEYGKGAVKVRFGQAAAMFALDAAVRGVVRAFTRSVDWLADWLPFSGLEGLVRTAQKILDNATTYVDETVFSYNIARGDENVWRSSRDGLVYYAQNWKPILRTAVTAWALEYAFTFAAFLLLLAPCLAVAAVMPRLGGWAFLIALIFAADAKSAVFRPLMLTMVALTFHKAAQNQPIDERAERALAAVGAPFERMASREQAAAAAAA